MFYPLFCAPRFTHFFVPLEFTLEISTNSIISTMGLANMYALDKPV